MTSPTAGSIGAQRAGIAPPAAVTTGTPQASLLQRKCACGAQSHGNAECPECAKRHGTLQRKGNGLAHSQGAPPIVHDVLRSPGQPIDRATRGTLEPRFGRDFSHVRIHTDSAAARSARAVNALAYTAGSHVVFDTHQYAPKTPNGLRLLAHELAHTVQQDRHGASLSPRLEVGAVDTAEELEADRVADRVASGLLAPGIHAAPARLMQRQKNPDAAGDTSEPNFDSDQQRGGRARAAVLDAGKQGEDQVRVAVTRYLCDCVGRNVTRTKASTHVKPGPGGTLELCNGEVTVRGNIDVVPSSFSTGRVTGRVEVNKAPGASGTGVKAGVEGEVRNTGSEPQAGGRADLRVKPKDGPEFGVSGEVFKGTQSGRIDTKIGAGVEVNVPGLGKTRIGVDTTNPQDSRRSVEATLNLPLPGQSVETTTCRDCRCPVVYECVRDIPPRDVKENVEFDVEERGRLRYYFQLDTDRDTPDPVLRGESTKMLDEVARRVAAGAHVASITGYASPEDNRDKPVPNQQLSLSRGKRLHDLLAGKLGVTPVPEASGGGELFGRVATIAPGSGLADAITSVGFGDPDDVTAFLIGEDIPNPKLADQFLALLDRVSEPADRLRLFGVDSASPAAPRLLAAIQQFVRSKGRGKRPWEGIFGFLRYATVELSTTHKESREESHRTSGSLTPMADAQCKPYANQAESEGRFGPAAPKPKDQASCPPGEPHNTERFASKCDYR
ncbi:MAG TPA: DUF4157 domain-containing protein [Rudaea sp.]|nr:DUF4157 domain-containing protein [Rudaea sp.]